MKYKQNFFLFFLFCFTFSGCASDNPDLYYSLRPEIDPVSVPLKQNTPTAIRYTELPPYYDREYFAYYGANQQIIINKKHHWVFPFTDNFRDALRQALAIETGNSRIYTYPIGDNIRPAVLIDIQIRDLIADVENKNFRISAQWQNSQRNSRNPENHQLNKILPLPDTAPDKIAATTELAVKELAKAIAESLKN